MGKRHQIIIHYLYNEDWIGGSYYIQNLVHALNTLENSKKPVLYIHSSNPESVQDLQKITKYPYIKEFKKNKLNYIQKGSNLISRKLLNRNIFSYFPKYEAIFPASFGKESEMEKQIFWIPDFQERYLPHFFSQKEIEDRDKDYKYVQEKAHHVIFSSKDAQKDFNTFYPNAKPQQYILNFAAFHSNEDLPSKEKVFNKFSINNDYFLCSNQFWIHKNHIVVLKAIALLKNEGIEISVVFTGKEKDYRNPDYFTNLIEKVKELGIEENVKFLGFIDRNEQIVLLKNCKSIIQPSLFEGWSTVNEDAKAENIFILAADISVNKEQLEHYPSHRFFNPNDEKTLADEIKKGNFNVESKDYSKEIKNFGENFLKILNTITAQKN